MQAITGYDVAILRQAEFPVTQATTYLNNASIVPLPTRTRQRVDQVIEEMHGNVTGFFGKEVIPMITEFMNEVAAFINAPEPVDICPITTTSAGINAVAGAIDWQPGDNIVFCDVEFPSNVYPWMAQEKQGVSCKIVPAQHGTLTLDALENAVNANTRLVTVSAIQFFTGARADLKAIGAFCRERGILFAVDAIQAIGHIPIDVQAMNIDILATGGQKSLMALTGAGFLYVRREPCEQMQPEIIGCNATDNWIQWLDYDMTPATGAARFGMGTPNVPGLYSVVSSLTLLNELGREHIQAHTLQLAQQFITALAERGIMENIPADPAYAGPLVSFPISEDHETTNKVMKMLIDNQIMVTKHGDAAGHPYLRISLHCYNNEDDYRHFFEIFDRAIKDNG